MSRGLERQVNPKIAALVILLVIAAVQAWWWRAFIWRPKSPTPRPKANMMQMPPGPAQETGRKDVAVETIAGDPEPGYADGPGRDARFDAPTGIAIGADGVLYVADSRNHRIRIVRPDGETTTLAGSTAGYRDGPARTARFRSPCGIAVDESGRVYVADTANHRIRLIANGEVSTLAGGDAGFASGRGAAARFRYPTAIVLTHHPAKALLIADCGNRRIRTVGLDGSVQSGTLLPSAPLSAALGAGGTGWESPLPDGASIARPGPAISGIHSALKSLSIAHPGVVLPLGPETRLLADASQGALLLVDGTTATVLAGGIQSPGSMLGWRDFSGDQALFGRIGGIVQDDAGRVYVSDTDANCIRRVTVPGLIRRKEAGP